jgi:hypothetical protein
MRRLLSFALVALALAAACTPASAEKRVALVISTSQANYDGTAAYGISSGVEFREKTVPVDLFQPNP